jgi:hypothetical protein
LNWESGDVKPALLIKKINGFQPATILRRRRRNFARMNCDEIGKFYPF